MRLYRYSFVVVAALLCFQVVSADDKPTAPQDASKDRIHVIDVVVVSSNQVRIGTNTMSILDAADLMVSRREKVDVVAIHDATLNDNLIQTKSPIMVRLASVGIPLVIVEKEGEHVWRDQSNEDHIRVVKLGTDQFAMLRRLLNRGKAPSSKASSPTLQTSVQIDAATGQYDLTRIELGLFGKRVWLMHEQPASEDESATIGLQIKKEW